MQLPDMTGKPPSAREARLVYSDKSARTVYWTDVEVPFPDGRLIVSRTNLEGIITHANEAFVEMSGHEREDLIGAPQHILRHPDMPQAAFKDLWETVKRGEKWHGYVKNLRKDGKWSNVRGATGGAWSTDDMTEIERLSAQTIAELMGE